MLDMKVAHCSLCMPTYFYSNCMNECYPKSYPVSRGIYTV